MSKRLEKQAIHLKHLLTRLGGVKEESTRSNLMQLIDYIHKQAFEVSDHQELQAFEMALMRHTCIIDFRYADNFEQHQQMNEELEKTSGLQFYGNAYSLNEVISNQDFIGGRFIVNFRECDESLVYTMFQDLDF